MDKQAEKNLELLQQQTATWIQEFMSNQRFGGLTSKQKRNFKQIITLFIKTMYCQHGRIPKKWTAQSVETCCLETLPESGALRDAFFLAMPPVLVAFFGYLEEIGQISNATVLIRAMNRVQEKHIKNACDIESTCGKKSLSESFGTGPGTEETLLSLRRFAAQIAKEIARERPALISREAMQSFERQPVLIFDILHLLSEQFNRPEQPDDYMLTAYFLLLSHSFQNIKFALERRFDWAREIYQEFQSVLVKQAMQENFPPQLLVGILESISEARLEISQELLDIYEYQITNYAPQQEVPTRGQVDAMFESLVHEHGGEPFAISDTLGQMIRALPLDAQSALIGEFAYSNLPGMKDAVVLLCLHTEATVRHEALQWLQQNAPSITSSALRRLIVMRNWVLPQERKWLDPLIRTARIKGVECAHWGTGSQLSSLQASQMDGVGAQSLLLSMVDEGEQTRIGAVLLKQNNGISDAWVTPSVSRQESALTFRQAGKREFFLDVSEEYLHAAIRHHLAVGLEQGEPPPIGLLLLAETLAATVWIPERMDGHAAVEQMILEAGPQAMDEQTLTKIIQTSGEWSDIPKITGSWFEDSQEVVTFMENRRVRNQERLVRQVLELFCEPNRMVWADRLAWTAFWLHAQTSKVKKMAGLDLHFAVMARELYQGRPLYELPIMRSIAYRTMTGESDNR
ncbi:MAG: hypothetical protein H7839_15695 [Magnetococcus sp. YQC-5]